MTVKLFCALFLAIFLSSPVAQSFWNDDHQLGEFIRNVEILVMNTTDQALLVTRNVYLNLSREMSPSLQEATSVMMQSYIQAVTEALQSPSGAADRNYTAKRKLLQNFRANNRRIDQLRSELDPLMPELQFQLISNAFYNKGHNLTEFDNLYMKFMHDFADLSQRLWDNMSERTVEDQEELLELLDEISKEQELRRKDKLYDEFIEMFLFKNESDEKDNKALY